MPATKLQSVPQHSTSPIVLGRFWDYNDDAVTSGTPTISLRKADGISVAAEGGVSEVGADGCAVFTPTVNDTSQVGMLKIIPDLAWAKPAWWDVEVVEANSLSPIINILPGFVSSQSQIVECGNFLALQNTVFETVFPVINYLGDPINLIAVDSLRMVFVDPNNNTVQFVATIGGAHGSIAVSGTNNNTITLALDATLTASVQHLKWILADETTKALFVRGTLRIIPFPSW